eukprot:7214574-Pyramimonas_sp.AAC.1
MPTHIFQLRCDVHVWAWSSGCLGVKTLLLAFVEALLEASWAVLGQLRANFGHVGGPRAVWGASLGRLGALLGCSRAVLEAILG